MGVVLLVENKRDLKAAVNSISKSKLDKSSKF